MRVRVDADRCQGHARCAAICPEVFELDELGFASTAQGALPPELEDGARRAAANCPESAIAIDAD